MMDVVRTFMSISTRKCKKTAQIDKLFQRSYYDHVVRDENDFQTIRQYIAENPAKWCEDLLYVEDDIKKAH